MSAGHCWLCNLGLLECEMSWDRESGFEMLKSDREQHHWTHKKNIEWMSGNLTGRTWVFGS